MNRNLCLTTETVESAALSLKSIDDIKRGDCLPLGVLSVGDSVANDALEERLENTTGLLVDHCSVLDGIICATGRRRLTSRDTLDTTTTRETSDRGLCDTLDVVTKNLAMALGTLRWELESGLTCQVTTEEDLRPCRDPFRPCRVQSC